MKKLLLLCSIALCVACASETEQKSLDRIAEIYDGKASYSKGFSSSAGSETIRTFTAKISDSHLIDSLNPNVTSSNIASLVFEGFTDDEREKYTQVNVEMVNKKGDTADYTYPMEILGNVYEKSKVFNSFSNGLLKRDASALDNIRNTAQIPEEIGDGVVKTLGNYTKKYGTLISYDPFGIAEMTDEQGAAYQFQAYLVFSSGKKLPYIVVVNTAPGSDKVDGFRFFE